MATDFREIFQLDLPQRLQLVEDLWDSIAAHPDAVPMSEWQRTELDRRQAAAAHDPAAASAWDEVLERLRKRSG